MWVLINQPLLQIRVGRLYLLYSETSIIRLSQICSKRRCAQSGEQAYDPEQARDDLTKYDESIQNHKRLGVKLSQMAASL
jgi:hypothetical protein